MHSPRRFLAISLIVLLFSSLGFATLTAEEVTNQTTETLAPNASEDELYAYVYKESIGIPFPMAFLRIGLLYLNYFNADAWPTGLFGLEWTGRNFTNSSLDLIEAKIYYGIGGMRFVETPGRKDYAKDFDANMEAFVGMYLAAEFDIGNNLAIYGDFEGSYAENHDNTNWQATLGGRYSQLDNPNLPVDGYQIYTEFHANYVRNQFSPIAALGGAAYISTGSPGDSVSFKVDFKANLAQNRGDGSIYLSMNRLKYWYPLLIDDKTGLVDIADAAGILTLGYRFQVFRVNDIFDGGKSSLEYRNGYYFGLEPFAFGGLLSVPGTGAVPVYGAGLNLLFIDTYGPFSARPILGGISVNFAALDQPAWLGVTVSF
jgi:hypothetical protein